MARSCERDLSRSIDHWVEVLKAAGAPCGPVYDYAQVRRRGMVQCGSKLGSHPSVKMYGRFTFSNLPDSKHLFRHWSFCPTAGLRLYDPKAGAG